MNDLALEHFLTACGSEDPLRLGVGQRDELMSETWTFRQPFLVIGRRPESDLVLDHWQVSRRHAYLQLIEGRYYCVDLGSRTGTHGGDATERSGWMERGRAIQIGPFAVRPEWPEPNPSASEPSPGVTWELPGRAIGQSIWRMDRHLALIGRSPACKIRIVEPDVSKFHCSVVLTPRGVWVVDLLGQNGILVNGQSVRCARLEDGDELRIGRHTLRARYDSPPLPLPQVESPAATVDFSPSSMTTILAKVEPSYSSRFARPGDELPARLKPPDPPSMPPMLSVPGSAIDPSVNILVHQFGLMQQQMFDQFHQTMMMMFEGFASLHREHASSLREEFDQVRKLSDEIDALRKETARLADEAAKPTPRPMPMPMPAARPIPKARPMPMPSTNGNGHGPVTPNTVTEPAQPRAQGPEGPPIKRVVAPAPDPDQDINIHSQLLLRLSSIQTERQSRWQKILKIMSTKS